MINILYLVLWFILILKFQSEFELSLSWAKINCITELNMKFYSKFYACLKQKQNYFYYSFDIHLIHSHDVFTFAYLHSHIRIETVIMSHLIQLTWHESSTWIKQNSILSLNLTFTSIEYTFNLFVTLIFWMTHCEPPPPSYHTLYHIPYHHLTSYIISQYHHANWWLNVDQIQNINVSQLKTSTKFMFIITKLKV